MICFWLRYSFEISSWFVRPITWNNWKGRPFWVQYWTATLYIGLPSEITFKDSGSVSYFDKVEYDAFIEESESRFSKTL